MKGSIRIIVFLVSIFALSVGTVGFLTGCGESVDYTDLCKQVITDSYEEKGYDVKSIELIEAEKTFKEGRGQYVAELTTDMSQEEIIDGICEQMMIDGGIFTHVYIAPENYGNYNPVYYGEYDSNEIGLTPKKVIINGDVYRCSGYDFTINNTIEYQFEGFNGTIAEYNVSGKEEDYSSDADEKSDYSSDDSAEDSGSIKDECIVDTGEKQIWKIHTTSIAFRMSATYEGSGNFIVTLSDSNQNHYATLCNEIGDYVLDDKYIAVQEGATYYLEIISTNGYWNGTWYGTGGQ